nr:hypothetical protein [uncultured Desulfobacter sp.]
MDGKDILFFYSLVGSNSGDSGFDFRADFNQDGPGINKLHFLFFTMCLGCECNCEVIEQSGNNSEYRILYFALNLMG